jgi:hypothetical protein
VTISDKMGCFRNQQGYAISCTRCWPNEPEKWCDSCFSRFAPKTFHGNVEDAKHRTNRPNNTTERKTDR